MCVCFFFWPGRERAGRVNVSGPYGLLIDFQLQRWYCITVCISETHAYNVLLRRSEGVENELHCQQVTILIVKQTFLESRFIVW